MKQTQDGLFFRIDSELKARFLEVLRENNHDYGPLFGKWIKVYIKKFGNKKNPVDKIAEKV